MKKLLSQKGFTLIEMLVVVAIIAILASVFLIGLRGFRGSAYDARRLSDLQKVQSYLELYYNHERVYPSNGSWSEVESAVAASVAGITTFPNDPIGGDTATYYYAQCAGGQGYVLGAQLSDPKASVMASSVTQDDLTANDCGSLGGGTCKDNGFYCVAF